ncbi:uncharacterized protein [Hetaerina americana]|uniref:uncharacterized protein isoform X1 n=1 Tax=Hetaerina americana TaxID=62018 RepID=UPI003A7F3A73
MAESQALQRLIQELENLIEMSSNYDHTSMKSICVAKDVINVPSSHLLRRNTTKQSNDTHQNLVDGEGQASDQDEEMLLEEEIKKILQIAENVRDKAVNKQSHKSKVFSFMDNKMTRITKTTNPSGVKGPAPKSRYISSGVKSAKKAVTKSDIKTVYQKDFSLSKSKSMPSLVDASKNSEVKKCRTLERNHCHLDKKMGPMQCKSVGLNSRQCAARNNKDFIKINKQNLGLEKKDTTREAYNNKEGSALATRLLQSSKDHESMLCEALTLRSQLPKHREILMVLREVYHFLAGSNRKAGKKELMLKENFLERCNSSTSRCDLEPDMHGILTSLLPYCGWVYGKNETITAKEMSNIKDTINKLEENFHSIQCSSKFNLKNELDQPKLSYVQKKLTMQKKFNWKESPCWHPLVMSSVFLGVEMPPFLYYNKTCEWISFQNAVLELHEYFIQLKLLQNVHPIITEVLDSLDSDKPTAESDDGNCIPSLAQLLKAAAVMADFTGHMTVPILAGIKSVGESPLN